MNRRTHGLISLMLLDAACWVALIAAFFDSIAAGIVYIGIVFFSVMLILSTYCARCPCDGESCGHVLPGRAAGISLSQKPHPYTSRDIAALTLTILLVIGVPHLWLFDRPVFLGLFWLLVLVSIIELRANVCPDCLNRYCPFRIGLPAEGYRPHEKV